MDGIGKKVGAAGEGERGDSALARGMRAIGICSIANTPAQVRADEPVKGAQVGCAEKGGGKGHAARSGFGRGLPKISPSAVIAPPLAATSARIKSALGFWSPYSSRVMVAALVPASAASLAAVLPSFERYSSRVMAL